MPEGGGLRISASYANEADPGKYVNIEIADNGCGIADENIDRVFIPFFTTKEGGAGLGLCVVYRVIQAHQGEIQISSNGEHGTIVSIQLPASSIEKARSVNARSDPYSG
jgi:signal transduction histidine kinase